MGNGFIHPWKFERKKTDYPLQTYDRLTCSFISTNFVEISLIKRRIKVQIY